MTRINLLPESYKLQKQQHQQRRHISRVAVISGVLLLAWSVGLVMQLKQVDRQAQQARAQLPALKQEIKKLDDLHAQRDRLQQQTRMLERLRDPISPAAVLALLTQLFPDDAVLHGLVIQVPPPAIELPRDPLSPQNRQRSAKTASPPPAKPIVMQLEGMVVSDVIAAQLARQLSQSGLFRNVRVENTQQLNHQGQAFHQFRVSIEIPVETPAANRPPVTRVASR